MNDSDSNMPNPFYLRIDLPRLDDLSPPEVLQRLTEGLDALRAECVSGFESALNHLKKDGLIKRFTNVTSRDIWTMSSSFPEAAVPLRDPPTLVELSRPGDFEVHFFGFEIAFHHGSPMGPPVKLGEYREPPSYLNVRPPWRVELYRAATRKLKKQDNFVFKLSLRLTLPVIQPTELPSPKGCTHDYRAVNIGARQWRIVWQCCHCGFSCHCACFETAIRFDGFPRQMTGLWPVTLPANHLEVPFVEGVCDACRGLPSSHRFCEANLAGSVFEARYGAYTRKRLAELRAAGERDPSETAAENEMRALLGFPPRGRPGFREAELFRIVKATFPDIEAIRRARPKWLQGLEIDIFVPQKKLAIEYQGNQHSAPMEHLGGESAFNRTQERDFRKRKILTEQNIILLTFDEFDEIESSVIQPKIKAALRRDPSWNTRPSP